MNNSDELKGASAGPASAGLTVGENVLQALGLSGQDVTSVSLEMTAAGEASLCVRLVARGPVLGALAADVATFPSVQAERAQRSVEARAQFLASTRAVRARGISAGSGKPE